MTYQEQLLLEIKKLELEYSVLKLKLELSSSSSSQRKPQISISLADRHMLRHADTKPISKVLLDCSYDGTKIPMLPSSKDNTNLNVSAEVFEHVNKLKAIHGYNTITAVHHLVSNNPKLFS